VTPEFKADIDPSISRQFGTVADDARVSRATAALEANGITVFRAANSAGAKRIVLGLIPDGSQVHHGASQSLEVSGIVEEIEKSGRYEHLRPRIWGMDRKTQADEIRRLSASPDVMLGSVHAVTETGSLQANPIGEGRVKYSGMSFGNGERGPRSGRRFGSTYGLLESFRIPPLSTRPISYARMTAWTRSRKSSLSRTCATCVLTVAALK
jgi:hypothetical protein